MKPRVPCQTFSGTRRAHADNRGCGCAVLGADLRSFGQTAAGERLPCGGSEIALGLPANFDPCPANPDWQPIHGSGAGLSGTCNRVKRAQVEAYAIAGPVREVTAQDASTGTDTAQSLADTRRKQAMGRHDDINVRPQSALGNATGDGRSAGNDPTPPPGMMPGFAWSGGATVHRPIRIARLISIRYQSDMRALLQNPEHIAELLAHVGRAARSEDGRSDLTAAQWSCLRFLARANVSTRTPSGFAQFQATTRGTASQIIKSLEARGLIARTRSSSDGRSIRLDLTAAGRAVLSRDPLGGLIGVIAALPATDQARFLGTLSHLAAQVAHLRQATAFGTCVDCRHFTPFDSGGSCACMAAAISAEQTSQLCGSYRSPSTPYGEPHGRP